MSLAKMVWRSPCVMPNFSITSTFASKCPQYVKQAGLEVYVGKLSLKDIALSHISLSVNTIFLSIYLCVHPCTVTQ